jgi:hypothetical protein
MNAIRIYTTVEQDGEIRVANLPLKKGQQVEVILLAENIGKGAVEFLTAQGLLESGIVGLWRDRADIGDAPDYARQLREQAQRRERA